MATIKNTKEEILAELDALQVKYNLMVNAYAPDAVESDALRAEIAGLRAQLAQYEQSTAESEALVVKVREELFNATQGAAVDERTAVVIPYIADKCKGEDLEIVIESWRKNFMGNLRLIVIGAPGIGLGDDVEVIERNGRSDFEVLADELERLPVSFVISPQNTVLASKCDIHDIALLKCRGILSESETSRRLKAEGKTIYLYDTNMPVMVHRAHLADAIADKFDGMGLINYAMNRNITRRPYMQVDGDGMYNFSHGTNPNLVKAEQALPQLKFYNFNCFSFPALKNFLRGYFGMEKKS